MMDDPYTVKEVIAYATSAFSAIIAWVVGTQIKRVDKLEESDKKHVTSDAMEQHRKEDRENFIKLFEGQDEIGREIGKGFRELDKTISGIHVDLLEKIADK